MNRDERMFAIRGAYTFILAIVLFCLVIMSVGCTGSQENLQSGQESEPKGYSADAGEVVNADKGCYVRTSTKRYNTDGELIMKDTWDHDNRGCVTLASTTKYKKDGDVIQSREYVNDENGYTTSAKVSTDGEVMEYSYETEVNSEGQRTGSKLVNYTNGVIFHNEYEYHDNGVLKEEKQESSGELVFLNRFDENGYQVEKSTLSERTTFDWQFDGYGRPVSVEVETEAKDEDSYEHVSYKFECDENGKICRQFDEDGLLVAEYDYEVIEDPLPAVLNASKRVEIYY